MTRKTLWFVNLSYDIHREPKKTKTLNSCPKLPQIWTDFQNSYTARLSAKFAINAYLNISSHFKTVVYATLWNIYVQKNRRAQEVIEANCRVRLNHSKPVLKYLSGKIFII